MMDKTYMVSGCGSKRAFQEFFPRAGSYSDMRTTPAGMVREADADDSFPYSERYLQCVWYDSSLRPNVFRSADGEDVVIEDPGRWNLEAGPDFFDASLTIGPERRKVRGDVEIHVRATDWREHGHMDDPAYARVVAHVSYFPGALPATSLPPGAIQISLRDVLKTNPIFSFESIDVTAYPYASLPVKLPECGEILASWQPDDWIALLESAGEERLRLKACRIAENIKERGGDHAFYEEIMCALGYKHNRLPFRQVALRLPIETLREECGGDVIRAYSLFLGVGGLLPPHASKRWDDEARAFIRQLWDAWWKQQSRWDKKCLTSDDWHLMGLRPHNHPVRRLAAAAGLFAPGKTLLSRITNLDKKSPETWFREAEKLFRESASMEFWKRRLSFSSVRQDGDIELLGASRISAILANVVIPFLAATGVEVKALLQHLPPEEDNNLTRRTAYALFGRDHNPVLYQKSGLRLQGLMQIFHDFCLNNKTACRGCRLTHALKMK